ncbi:hypothetical protein QBC39DRAFT_27439 [Podospora conica]|nr:hypothetical protein QBC39DRAFT_27439 [Schizothecium conicum]
MATEITGYEGTYPATTPAEPSLKAFLSNFYRLSDSPEHNDEWTAQFLDDAVIRLGPKTAKGREEIKPFRAGMWEKVESRRHRLGRVMVGGFEEGEVEVMITGSVKYRMRGDGGEVEVEWAGHGRVVRDGGGWRFGAYRVWL